MLHLDFNNLKLDRVLIELRFQDTFKIGLPEVRFKLLEKFTRKYSMYDNNNTEALGFYNPEKQMQLEIRLNRCLITWDQPNNLPEFLKSAKGDFSFLLSQLDINVLHRVGVRTFNSYEAQNQQVIDQFIFKEYLAPGVCSPNFADEYFSPRVQMSGKKKGILFNLAISHQQEQVIQGKVNEIVNSKIHDTLVIDLDSYKENIKVSKLEPFLNDVRNLNEDSINYLQTFKQGIMI
ncbi:hypothetical protein OCA41_05235 [Bacillus cereus]|nr:hypothetical protein [Bacillus cereus]